MNTADTRDRLLDAAQSLFVQRGIDATSLRSITTEADANLASVNYHFGSKDELIQAVFARYLEPLNNERIRLLNALEENAGPDALPLESILEAFLKPAFVMMKHQKHREFVCLLGRLFTESSELRMAILHQFQEVQQRFFAAIQRTLPNLPLEDLIWRAHFMIGAMAHTFAVPEKISLPASNESIDTSNVNIMKHLITFSAAGLRAQATSKTNGAQQS